MSKKYFILAFVFVLVSAVLGGGAWLYTSWRDSLTLTGEPTFAATKSRLTHLGKVTIANPDGTVITLSRQEGIWRFEEAKNYFASIERMNDLLRMFNDSAVISADETDKRQLKRRGLDEKSGILLQTYALDGKLLDQIIIGNKDKKGICYARQPQSATYIERISACGNFTGQVADWMPYPLISLPQHLIDRITTPEKRLDRKEIEQKILQSGTMRRFILTLNGIDYQGILLRDELANNPDLEIETRQIDVELADGLVYALQIHRIGDEYWLEPDLKVGRIAKQTVPGFVEKNRRFYENWVFKLDKAQGKLMFEFDGGKAP